MLRIGGDHSITKADASRLPFEFFVSVKRNVDDATGISTAADFDARLLVYALRNEQEITRTEEPATFNIFIDSNKIID